MLPALLHVACTVAPRAPFRRAPLRRALVGVVVAVGIAVGVAGCAPPPLAPTDGDDVPSVTARAATIAAWELVDGWRVSPTLAAPTGATRVGVLARVQPGATAALQARVVDGSADDEDDAGWVSLSTTWRDTQGDDGRFVAVVDLPRVARAVQLRVDDDDLGRVQALTWEAIVPDPRPALATTRETPVVVTAPSSASRAVLDGYEPRSAWGARSSSCDSNPSKTKVTVHHTVSPLNEGGTRAEFTSELRGIQAFHMDSRGYCDVGYHFLVTSDGTVWEGRNASSLGAHTGGQNTNNLGISFIGCFHPTADCNGLGSTTPPQAMIDGAGAFLGRASRHYGITLSFGSTFFGHRDNPGQSTSCPGDLLHDRLDDLEAIAEGGSTPTTTGRVQGTVWNLAITDDITQVDALGARLPGATVTALQGTTTVATSTARAGDAYWSLDVPPGSYTLSATLDGFATATRAVDIASGDERWSSMGLAPAQQAVDVVVTVVDAVTRAPLPLATVQFGANDEPRTADGEGRVSAAFPPGPLAIVARAEGYLQRTEERTLVAGTPLELELGLEADAVPPPEEPPLPVDDGDDGLQRLVIRNAPGVRASGGCACAAGDNAVDAAPLALAACALLLRRRRR
jgi:hypothetical protein